MPRSELLPGISHRGCPPVVHCDPRPAIRRARRRALFRDISQLLLVAGVDALLIRWPAAHVPLMSRFDSIALVVAMNVLMLGYVWLTRAFPKWSARRIATTWCPAERGHLARTCQASRLARR
ncbi:MAG TPA: hypothetical protein VJ901_20155 [Thermoanaerobaculia bacterium]|nr:hypothetical protein [Thermoanaerobaculia bacterium]